MTLLLEVNKITPTICTTSDTLLLENEKGVTVFFGKRIQVTFSVFIIIVILIIFHFTLRDNLQRFNETKIQNLENA